MKEAKHTPAPWQILPEECDRPYIRIRGIALGTRYKIANVLTPNHDGVHPREAQETRANARRIVACVNACEGIEDPENVVPQLRRANDRVLQLEPLRLQRDELLQALKALTSASDVVAYGAAFHAAAAKLRAAGYTVVNPAELHQTEPGNWLACMWTDLAAMAAARPDGIATLDGWPGSKGGRVEVHLGWGLRLPVRRVADRVRIAPTDPQAAADHPPASPWAHALASVIAHTTPATPPQP
jgi:hypothetical protein